jgi:hypothetical protein
LVRDRTLNSPPPPPPFEASSSVDFDLGTKASRSFPAGEGLRFAASLGAVIVSSFLLGDAVMNVVEVKGSAGIEGDDVVKKPLCEG